MILGTVAANAVTTITVDWVPEMLFFPTDQTANCPVSVKVNVNGRGIVTDLDADGIKWISRLRRVGFAPTVGFGVWVADGLIKGRTTQITVDNTGGTAYDLHGINQRTGSMFMQSFSNVVLAKSGVDITKFTAAGFPNAVAADIFNLTYADGTIQQASMDELQNIATFVQNNTSDKYSQIADNFEQVYKMVNFIPAAQQLIYIMRVVPDAGVLNVKLTN